MIKAISQSGFLKRSLIGMALIGSAGICQTIPKEQENNKIPEPQNEIISKKGADALKSNAININTVLNLKKRVPNGMFDTIEYEYDSRGRVVTEFEISDNRELLYYYTYEYNDNDTPRCDKKFDSNGKLCYIKAYHYNFDGTKAEVTIFDDDISCIHEYDKNDNLKRLTVYKPDGSLDLEYVYTTDKNGKRTETIYDFEGNIIQAD